MGETGGAIVVACCASQTIGPLHPQVIECRNHLDPFPSNVAGGG